MASNKRVLFTNLRSLKVERTAPIFEAKKLGFDVVLMAKEPIPSLAHIVDDYVIVDDLYNHDRCLESIVNFHKKRPISGVFSWSDRDVELVAMVGDQLQLRTLSTSSAKTVRNKYEMRKKLSKIPGLCPRFFFVDSLENLKFAMSEINGKAILKPVGASGSTAILKLAPNSNLEKAYEDMLSMSDPTRFPMCGLYRNQYICEEYIEGPEVCVDGFICDKKINIFGVSDKDVIGEYSQEYHAFFPSVKPKLIIDEIKKRAQIALQALELDNAPFHLEGRYTDKGFMVLECAGRTAGGFLISHIVQYVTGYSPIREIIKMGAGQDPQWKGSDENIICYGGMWFNLPTKEGVVTSIQGVDDALEVEGIKYAIPCLKPGDPVLLPPKSFSCIEGVIIATADTGQKLRDNIQAAARKMIVNLNE